jgi:hypothetical protein
MRFMVGRQQASDEIELERAEIQGMPSDPTALTVISPCGAQECLFPSRDLTITKTVEWVDGYYFGPSTQTSSRWVNQQAVSRVATYRDAQVRVNNLPTLFGPYWYTDAYLIDRFDDVVFPTVTGGPAVYSAGDYMPYCRYLKIAFLCMGRGTMTLLAMWGRTAAEANAWHTISGGDQPDIIYSVPPYSGQFYAPFAGQNEFQASLLPADGYTFSNPLTNPFTVFFSRSCSPLKTRTGSLNRYAVGTGGALIDTYVSFNWIVEDIP